MSGNDLVKYMTEEFMKYIDMPKKEREKLKQQRKEIKQANQPQISNKWFGLLPVSIKLWRNKSDK